MNDIFTHRIIPVVTIENPDDAEHIATALIKGGVKIIEVTLRTEKAFEAIAKIAGRSDIIVGAGTVTTPEVFDKSIKAGAKFIVSPGITSELLSHAKKSNVTYIPGVVTPSEVMQASASGFTNLKFFPAEISGGVKALKNYASLFKTIKFCPTGGIDQKNIKDYQSLPNVFAIGGSWLVTQDAVKSKNWDEITKLSKEAGK